MKGWLLAVPIGGVGCGESGSSTFMVKPPSSAPEPSTTCPFGIRGARATMTNTEDGVAIAIRAYGDVEGFGPIEA